MVLISGVLGGTLGAIAAAPEIVSHAGTALLGAAHYVKDWGQNVANSFNESTKNWQPLFKPAETSRVITSDSVDVPVSDHERAKQLNQRKYIDLSYQPISMGKQRKQYIPGVKIPRELYEQGVVRGNGGIQRKATGHSGGMIPSIIRTIGSSLVRGAVKAATGSSVVGSLAGVGANFVLSGGRYYQGHLGRTIGSALVRGATNYMRTPRQPGQPRQPRQPRQQRGVMEPTTTSTTTSVSRTSVDLRRRNPRQPRGVLEPTTTSTNTSISRPSRDMRRRPPTTTTTSSTGIGTPQRYNGTISTNYLLNQLQLN